MQLCVFVWCGEKEIGRVCNICGVEGNKDVYEILGLPQRASNSHNHVQYYYRMAIFTNLQRLHHHFARHPRRHFITLDSLMLIVLVFSVGAHHSMVHWLPVSHPGFIPGLLCGKGVKWWIWDLCWCSLVGTGKTKLKNNKGLQYLLISLENYSVKKLAFCDVIILILFPVSSHFYHTMSITCTTPLKSNSDFLFIR